MPLHPPPSSPSVLTDPPPAHRLEEKFRIYNRDDLASALRSRLSELPSLTDGFTPELLSLFLLISDRPLENSRLDDLDALVPAEEPKGLTWADIIADDPLHGDIWRDVDFGAESSDAWSDDGVSAQQLRDEIIEERKLEEEGRKKKKCSTDDEEEEEEEEDRSAEGVEGFMVSGDQEGLRELKKAQYWDQVIKPVDGEVDVSLGFGGGISHALQIRIELTRCPQGRISRSFPSSKPSAKSYSCCSATRASSSAKPAPATK